MSADRHTTDFGRMLREARERKGVSLRQIANATKISVAVLEGLERNDISRLPGGIFGRAFVRSYASEVGLDPEATIQEFIAQFKSDTVTAGHSSSERFEDGEALESRRRTALTFLALIVLGLPIAAATVYFTLSGRSAPVPAPAPVAAVAPRLPPPDEPPPPPADLAAPPPAQPAPAVAQDQAAADGRSAKNDAGAERFVVSLSVSRECWLSATVDGRKEVERVLQPGDQRTVEVFRDLVLTAGDAGAVAMTINGTQAKPLGRSGEVVTARLDLSNFKSFLSAR
jgi:cytoskeletal protein RodZ